MLAINDGLDDEFAIFLSSAAIGLSGLDDTSPHILGTVAHALGRDIHQAAQQCFSSEFAVGFEQGRRDEWPKAIFKL